jgi:hypothetical protein
MPIEDSIEISIEYSIAKPIAFSIAYSIEKSIGDIIIYAFSDGILLVHAYLQGIRFWYIMYIKFAATRYIVHFDEI